VSPALRDWPGIFRRAVRESLDDDLPLIASALAYSSFFVIPSALLLALGVFSLLSGPDTIRELMDRLDEVIPAEAAELLGDSLTQLERQQAAGLSITLLGLVLALWASTSAMTTYMAALNRAYHLEDRRGFVRKRLIALVMVVAIGLAVGLVAVLLIFGPHVERWLGGVLGLETAVSWVWWTVQWPVLVLGLLTAFSVLYALAPDQKRRLTLVTPGAVVAVIAWLAVSGAFAVYTSLFGSYNKAWGSLSAVIVTLTWLWLSSIALLFGGEVNAEVEASRSPPPD
jgi:membrane protein